MLNAVNDREGRYLKTLYDTIIKYRFTNRLEFSISGTDNSQPIIEQLARKGYFQRHASISTDFILTNHGWFNLIENYSD